MLRSAPVVLALGGLALTLACDGEGARAGSTVTATDTGGYWTSPGAGCREGDPRARFSDAAVARELGSCADVQEWKDPRRGRWVADEQLLTVCTNADDVATCRPITWAVAVPHRRLEKFKDADFARGPVPVARLLADRDYPDTPAPRIRGRPWRNTVFVQQVGTDWFAFVVYTHESETSPPYLLGAVTRMVHTDDAGRAIDPPGHVLWWFKPDLESMDAGAGGGADDGLWTRCGTGCCTIDGFRSAK